MHDGYRPMGSAVSGKGTHSGRHSLPLRRRKQRQAKTPLMENRRMQSYPRTLLRSVETASFRNRSRNSLLRDFLFNHHLHKEMIQLFGEMRWNLRGGGWKGAGGAWFCRIIQKTGKTVIGHGRSNKQKLLMHINQLQLIWPV